MLYVVYSKKYKKTLRKYVSSGSFPKQELIDVVNDLKNRKILPIKYNDHQLKGDFDGTRECHIRPDILLIYQIKDKELILLLVNIGSHSKLF